MSVRTAASASSRVGPRPARKILLPSASNSRLCPFVFSRPRLALRWLPSAARGNVNKASTLAPIVPAGGKGCARFIGQNSHYCIDNNGHRRAPTAAGAPEREQGPCGRAPPSENPPFSPAALFSLIVRGAAITSMAFAVAFGFLAGATSPAAHYDPHMFAIGVAALFGAACGAMGILLSRIRQMKTELRNLEARLDEAADRNWEIREAQERTASFFEAQGDVIVRRDGNGAITYANDAFCALAGRPRDDLLATALRCRWWSRASPAALPTARACTTRKSPRRRRALDRLARSHRARRWRQRNAKRRPRHHRPRARRAGAGRGARSGRGGEPRQVALPDHGVARDPHAAQRHSRHGRSPWRHPADRRNRRPI